MARSLYICYFGVNEPLVNTQVIPYLRELTKDGHEITLLTFEPGEVDEADVRGRLAEQGIEWQWLRYHKRPSVPATLFDIANGLRYVRKLSRKKKFDIFHVRGHIPAPIGAMAKKMLGGKLLFDIRGFLPEEYVDAGVWDEKGMVYKAFKRVERWVMREADGFVVLTEAARNILFPESAESGFDKLDRPVEVIPCCVDLSRFSAGTGESRDEARTRLGLTGKSVAVYVGSFGGWYLSDAIFDFFEAMRKDDPNAFAMILTQRDQEKIESTLKERGFDASNLMVKSVPHAEIDSYLRAGDFAISFIKSSYSKKSSSPTKLAEYLAAGLPVISNRGVGDVDATIENNGVGTMVEHLSESAYVQAIQEVTSKGDISDRCREVAIREFDLDTVGGPRYRRIYEKLLNSE